MRKWIMSACALAWLALALAAVAGLRGPGPARASGTAVSSNASTTTSSSSASTSAATSNPTTSNPAASNPAASSANTSNPGAGNPDAGRAGGAAPVTTAGGPRATRASVPAALDAAAPAARQPAGTARWTVRPGDTLSGIAAALALPGGWPALYAANKAAIGPDPNVITAGTVLAVPGATPPARYTVAPGDTLSGIAAALALPGGWPALYAANKAAIGPHPNDIHPGTVLTTPPPAAGGRVPSQQTASASQPGRAPAPSGTSQPTGAARQAPSGGQPTGQAASGQATMPASAAPGRTAASAAPPNPAAGRTTAPGQAAAPPNAAAPGRTAAPGQSAAPARVGAPAQAPADGMPRWLQDTLLAAGVLAATAFAAEPAAALARRRRNNPGAPRPAPNTPAAPAAPAEPAAPVAPRRGPARRAADQAARRAKITLADYERLIVTYSAADHAVYVLTPPGEDPATVLRAARLVLPEDTYEDLAGHLGVPSGWPLE